MECSLSLCPVCNNVPHIVSVYEMRDKFVIRCFGCDYTLGRYVNHQWAPIYFESVDDAVSYWNEIVKNCIDSESFWKKN